MLMTEIAKTVTNILKLSPTHFVSNIRHQHLCSRIFWSKLVNRTTYFWQKGHICQVQFIESTFNIRSDCFVCSWFQWWRIRIIMSDISNNVMTGIALNGFNSLLLTYSCYIAQSRGTKRSVNLKTILSPRITTVIQSNRRWSPTFLFNI